MDGVTQSLPEAEITFDKFVMLKACLRHDVTQLIGAAVDQTRRAEAKSRPELLRSRYL